MKHVRTFKPLSFASPVAVVVAVATLAALGATGAAGATGASSHNADVRANAHPGAEAAVVLAAQARNLPPLIFGRVDDVAAAADAAGAASDRDAPDAAILTAFGREARVDFHVGGVTILQVEPRPAAGEAGGPALKGLPVRFDADGTMVERPLPESARPNWRRVEVSFAGDDEHGGRRVVPVGEDRQATIVSIFKGREPQWRTGLPTFAAVRYPSAWPGVDVVFAADGDGLAAHIEARPGADASAARLTVRCVGPCPSAGRGVAGLVAGSMRSAGSAGERRPSPGRAELQLGPVRRSRPN
ncbi:MAG: hypothetical protein ABI780_09185, partial [Ardenticatenales bacterium]